MRQEGSKKESVHKYINSIFKKSGTYQDDSSDDSLDDHIMPQPQSRYKKKSFS